MTKRERRRAAQQARAEAVNATLVADLDTRADLEPVAPDELRAVLGDGLAEVLAPFDELCVVAGVRVVAAIVAGTPYRDNGQIIAAARQAYDNALRRVQTAAARDLLGPNTGPVTFEVLIGLRGDLAEPVGAHRACGLLPASVDPDAAVTILVDGPSALRRWLPSPTAEVDVKTAAATLGVPQVAVRALLYCTGQARLSHALLDEWATTAAADRAAFTDCVATARAEEQRRRAEVRAARQTAKAAREAAAAAAEQIRARQVAVRTELGLRTDVYHLGDVRTSDVADVLGISAAQVRAAIDRGDLAARLMSVQTSYGRQDRWMVALDDLAALTVDVPGWLQAARTRTRKAQARAVAADQKARLAQAGVRVRLPLRQTTPVSMVAHLGPTNSGKTHEALALLAARGRGVYAAPLRMLAAEAADRLAAALGADQVGLITGEEQRNPHAPVLCCTPECAPTTADTMVLDEVHWLADPDRGWAWARLLAGAEVTHLRLAGALEVEPLLRVALGDQLAVRRHDRLGPITYAGRARLTTIRPGTLLVSFSRRSVLALARAVTDATGLRVGVLYGALPPAARQDTIDRFTSGDLDVLSVTDVIGHGINLPTDTVVLAETTKFDGTRRRPLHRWEVAQIVGRAGRYGLADSGTVYTLGNRHLAADPQLVATGTAIAAGETGSDLRLTRGELRPTLTDLAVEDPHRFEQHLRTWENAARKALAGHAWLTCRPVEPLIAGIGMLGRRVRAALGVDGVWRLANLPVDDPAHLAAFAQAAAFGTPLPLPDDQQINWMDLEGLEAVASWARDCLVFTRAFGDIAGISHDAARRVEQAAARRIVNLLPGEVTGNEYGRCESCGRSCPPWFDRCDTCHRDTFGWYDDEAWSA
jgi:ATP-dependent RNA helicase SUPV3L1/SUV3